MEKSLAQGTSYAADEVARVMKILEGKACIAQTGSSSKASCAAALRA